MKCTEWDQKYWDTGGGVQRKYCSVDLNASGGKSGIATVFSSGDGEEPPTSIK